MSKEASARGLDHGRIATGVIASLGLWWFAHGGLTLLGGNRSLLLDPPAPPTWRFWLESCTGLALLAVGLIFHWRGERNRRSRR